MPVRTALRLLLPALVLGAALLAAWAGCSDDAVDPGPVVPADTIPYGGGTVSFDAVTAGGAFSASGAYKPSALFATDTAGEGSGGFLHDTAAAGRPYQARLNAYTHRLSGGLLSERVLVVTLHNAAGALDTGAYAVTLADSSAPGKSAWVTYLFFSDSLAEYAVFEGAAGVVTVTGLDAGARRVEGTFSLELRSAPPDTTRHAAIAGGAFNVMLTGRYYDY